MKKGILSFFHLLRYLLVLYCFPPPPFFLDDNIHIVAEKMKPAHRSGRNSKVAINILKNFFVIGAQRKTPINNMTS